MTAGQRDKAMRYLLGSLPEQEAIEFEKHFFLDDDLFEETAALENDLVDSYLLGELSEAERRQFENGYLISPARRANLEFSRALARSLPSQKPVQSRLVPKSAPRFLSSPIWRERSAWIAAIALTIVALVWSITISMGLRRRIDSMQAEQVRLLRNEQELQRQLAALHIELNDQSKDSAIRQEHATILSLVLVPGLNRSAGSMKQLVIPSQASMVRITLYLEHDAYRTYRASVINVNAGQIWMKKDLASEVAIQGRRAVFLEVPASLLAQGEYIVKLEGLAAGDKTEEVEDYRFHVMRQ